MVSTEDQKTEKIEINKKTLRCLRYMSLKKKGMMMHDTDIMGINPCPSATNQSTGHIESNQQGPYHGK